MKVCYFIQSHKDPEQICRLVQVIKQLSPDAEVLISHDFSTSYLDMTLFSSLSNISLIRRERAAIRGTFSLLEVYLDAVDWLFEHNSEFDWLVYLSGQDYPTQSLAEVEKFLAQTEYDGFMQYFNVLSPECSWGANRSYRRYFCQYYHLPTWTRPFLQKISKIQDFTPIRFHWNISSGVMAGLRVKSVPFNEKFVCYGGWCWVTLSRKCVQFVRDYLREHPKLLKYYKRTICPEESLLQTVLINSGKFNICNDDKRYCYFPPQLNGFAKVLTAEDYPTLVDNDFHFARKVDPNQDKTILNMLDAKLLQNGLLDKSST